MERVVRAPAEALEVQVQNSRSAARGLGAHRGGLRSQKAAWGRGLRKLCARCKVRAIGLIVTRGRGPVPWLVSPDAPLGGIQRIPVGGFALTDGTGPCLLCGCTE